MRAVSLSTLVVVSLALGCARPPSKRAASSSADAQVFDATPDIRVDVSPDQGQQPDSTAGPLATLTFTDDSFDDFSKGSLSDAGAKVYVSADGSVRLVDNWDLDGDGYLDLVVSAASNLRSDRFTPSHSFVFFGSRRGPPSRRILALPTPALASAIADINADGFPDVVFSKFDRRGPPPPRSAAVIYFGSPAGLSRHRRRDLPDLQNMSINGSSIADLDRDGYLDLVVAGDFAARSLVYWGSPDGYHHSSATELGTFGSPGVAIADFDGDGNLDLFFPNTEGKSSGRSAFLYWGAGKRRFSPTNKSKIPLERSFCATPADMNNDGHIDLVVGLHVQGGGEILWGRAGGPPGRTRTKFGQVKWPHELTVADIDDDGHLDVLFAENGTGATGNTSQIFWGPTFSQRHATSFSTAEAIGAMVADFTGDGLKDVAITQIRRYGIHPAPTLIFKQLRRRFFSKHPVELDTPGGTFSTTTDLGSVSRRKPTETFTSRAFDTGRADVRYDELLWEATAPTHARATLRFRLRSASSRSALAKARWMGPTGPNDTYRARMGGKTKAAINRVHDGDRYIQYQAILGSAYTGGPVLERVTVRASYVED